LTQGPQAAAGYAVGGLGTLLPAAVAAYALKKSTKDDTTVRVLALVAGGTVLYGIYKGFTRR
jgi:zinc transporter ZupT